MHVSSSSDAGTGTRADRARGTGEAGGSAATGARGTGRGPVRARAGRSRPGRLAAATAAATLVLTTAACGGSSGGGSSGGDQAITVAIPPAVSGVDVYAAQAQGYFARHHLKVKVKTLNGGSAIVPAMASGAVQIGESNVLSVIQGAARGVKDPCFAGANTDPPSGHYLSLVAAPGSGVRAASGLTGKTIGVNATSGINQLLADAYLSANGVHPSSVHFIGLTFPDMPAALKSGRIAASVTTEPFTSIALRRGATLLTGTPLAAIPGTPTYSCWNASKGWLSSHKAAAAGFAAAMRQTDAYINAHPDAFRSLVGEHLKVDSRIQATMTLPLFTDRLTRGDVTAWEQAARTYGLLHTTPPMSGVLVGVG